MKYPLVSVIFPTLNGWKDTKLTLKSLYRLNYPAKNLEIIIIDNNSSDGTPILVRKMFPKVSVYIQQENLGYSKAVNIGIRKSRGKYILLSNNDITFEKNYLKNMVELAQTDPNIGIIGSKVYLKSQKNKYGFGGLKINPYLGFFKYDLTNLDCVRDCDVPPTGGFFVRKKIFKTVGLLDEGFFLYFEDIDFSIRVKKAGYKILFNPASISFHGQSHTAYREIPYEKIIYQGYKSKWRCIFKHLTFLQILTSLFLQFFVTIHIENKRSTIKTYTPFLKAFLWNVSNLKETINIRNKSKTNYSRQFSLENL